MAKVAYKIPDSLDKSTFDMELSLKNDEGMGLRPLPLKLILAWLASLLLLLYICFNTFIGGFVPLTVIFGVAWVALTVILFKQDDTGELQLERVRAIDDYYPKSRRYVVCRNDSESGGFWSITKLKSIDEDTGLIEWDDGTYGYMYRVVGTGSILLFESDRDAIINRVDSFWRKVRDSSEWIWITTREAQQVYHQIAALKYRYDNLRDDTGELRELLDLQYVYLKDYVGGLFRSVHQYLVIKAPNMEELNVAQNILESEVEGSAYMLRQCTGLVGEDQYRMYRTIYRGKESV